jgi:hypothetical protein
LETDFLKIIDINISHAIYRFYTTRYAQGASIVFVIIGFLSVCSVPAGLIVRQIKRRSAKKREEILKIHKLQQNDWRYSRRPDDLRDAPELYTIDDVISILRQLRYNGRGETRAYNHLRQSKQISITNVDHFTNIYKFDGIKLRINFRNDRVAIAALSERSYEKWISINRDKDLLERAEQMLNRLIILIGKTKQELEKEDDKKFAEQKVAILGSSKIKRIEYNNIILPTQGNIPISCDIILHNPYE